MAPEVKFIGAWSLTERLGLAGNFNIARPFDGSHRFSELAGSASFGYSVSERVGVYAEAFGIATRDGSHVVRKFVNGGMTLLINPDVQFDIRAGIGPSARARDGFAGAGLVFRR
ncbi:MAG: transporter [Gemmatimonadaceae bacterium]|nr:transporter [Gemmatimonadaceae bacterium]